MIRHVLMAALAAAALAGAAQAQSLSTSASAFNAGYGRTFGQENRPVDLDGRLTTLADASLLPTSPIEPPATVATSNAGVADLALGASEGGATIVPADHLVVLTQGNWRTRSQATASARDDASADLNGKIDLNGPN